MNIILNQLPNLETFINPYPELLQLQLVMSFHKNLQPFPSMLNSIKRLEINSVFRYDEGILARNAVWILTFYTNLRQAILAVLITFKDSKWLSEYVKIFGGLSKIKDLAIRLNFLFDSKNRSTWWGLPSEVKQSWKCGSRRSKAVHDLLSVTSGELNSLELWTSRSVDRPGDDTKVYEDCLNGLYRSFNSLSHLRIFGPQPNPSAQFFLQHWI